MIKDGFYICLKGVSESEFYSLNLFSFETGKVYEKIPAGYAKNQFYLKTEKEYATIYRADYFNEENFLKYFRLLTQDELIIKDIIE
jgi:hypothetical protein